MHYIRAGQEPVDPHALEAWVGRAQRRDVDHDAFICLPQGRIAVTLTNISYQGCRFDCDVHVQIGDCFPLIVPGLGKIAVQVRWSDGASLGVAFFEDRQIPQSH